MPVHDRVRLHAQQQPHAVAISIDDQTLSWQQLWQRTNALYQHFREWGAVTGTVAIATGNDIAFPVAWLAATAQPCTAAIIDPQMPPERLHDVLTRLTPELLVLKSHDLALIALAERLAIRWLAIDLWQPESCVGDDPALTEGMQAATPFLINFTSGTTSLPKAYIRSRRSWRSSFENGEAIFRLKEAPSTLFPGPLSHGIGLYCLNETLYAGGRFYSTTAWQPAQALALMAQQHIARLVVVPTMISGLARAAQQQVYPHLRSLLSAGAKLELNHYRQARSLFPQAVIQEYYGASELGFIAVSTLDDDNIASALNSVGQAFPGTEITIRNQQGEVMPPNQPGTIFLSSEQIIDRYLWGDDGQAFKKYPWGATVADVGYLDEQQRLHLVGRPGNMIQSGGNNIYLSEVESVLQTLEGVTEAVAIAVDDAYLGKKIVAIVQAQAETLQRLPQHCRARLAKYKLPRHYYQIQRWPLTSGGKIQRAGLEEMIKDGRCIEFTELSA